MEQADLIEQIQKKLIKKEETIAVAESVTAGNLQAALSSIEDAAMYFQGGITAYNIGIKCRLLNIEPIHALPQNCVSEKVAAEMALNVVKLFCSDYGIGITGYAKKDPEMGIDELYAYFALAKNDKILLKNKLKTDKKTLEEVQLDYTLQVLKKLNRKLSGD